MFCFIHIRHMCLLAFVSLCFFVGFGPGCAATPQGEKTHEPAGQEALVEKVSEPAQIERVSEPIVEEPLADAASESIEPEPVPERSVERGVPELTKEESPEQVRDVWEEQIPEAAKEASPETIVEKAPVGKPFLYTSQTDGKIFTYEVDTTNGQLKRLHQHQGGALMRFLSFHPKKTHVYAVSGNKVQSFKINQKTGALSFLNEAKSGEFGTHLEVDHTGRFVFVASYGGNQVSMLPIKANGRVSAATFQKGGQNNTSFCVKAHQVRVHPSNKFVYVPCLGSDYILRFAFDAATGTLTQKGKHSVIKGAGPRHMDFHPTQPWAYVVNELDSSVVVFDVNTNNGALTQKQTVRTLPLQVSAPSKSSDIHVSPDGKYLYAINREPLNNVAMFSIGGQGKLKLLGHVSTNGQHARSFVIDPFLPYMYIANANSQNLGHFQVDAAGKLTHTKTYGGFTNRLFFVGILRLP
ncbi:MAG: hypothetical protein CL920_26430 [Deltaproteobacteria bacterium]|nr:hypothetical protein [Deltaproteobacteria bacterium]